MHFLFGVDTAHVLMQIILGNNLPAAADEYLARIAVGPIDRCVTLGIGCREDYEDAW
jgi:hypothetical protein